MAKTYFLPRTPITANFLNSLNNPTFAESPSEDGQFPLINDARMSQASTELLARANNFLNAFTCKIGTTALTIEMIAPRRIRANGSIATGNAGQIFVVPASSTGEVWLDWFSGQFFVANYATNTNLKPAASLTICNWETSATAVTQLINRAGGYRHVDAPAAQSLVLFGGRGVDDATWNGNGAAYSEERYSLNNLTINLGTNPVVFSRPTLVQVAGNLTINGNGIISVLASEQPGGGILGNNNPGTIIVNTSPSATGGFSTGYSWTLGKAGNAGSGGSGALFNVSVTGAIGGYGGSFLKFQVSGEIRVNGSLTIECFGTAGGVAGFNYSTSGTPFSVIASGGGGGSGGLIHLQAGQAIRYTQPPTFDVRGGRGGNAFSSSTNPALAVAGCGAGGGWVIEESPIIVGTPTYILTEGSRGNDAGTFVSNIGGGTNGAGYGGDGGFTFLSTALTPTATDIVLPYTGSTWCYRPAKPGQQLRLLRYPLVLS